MENRLEVWKLSHELTMLVYKVTSTFPQAEQFGLVNQLRRGASSIPANIVEGQARQHKKEFVQFLYIARGSAEEAHYHLFLSRELGYIDAETYLKLDDMCTRVKMMLAKLIKSQQA